MSSQKAKFKNYQDIAAKFFLLCLIIIAAGSCKKDGDQGPQGVPGPAGNAFNYKQGGFIQGTISGTRSDGTPFNINFDNRYYHILDNFSYDEFSFLYNFSVERHPSSDPLAQGYCLFDFSLSSLSSATAIDSRFYGFFFQDLGNNQKFEFNVDASSSSFSTIIVSNLSYNSSSHLAQGNFAINVDAGDNSTGNPATISGSFQSISMTEYVTRINPENEIIHSKQ